MSRYMEAINLLIAMRDRDYVPLDIAVRIKEVLAMEESPGEVAIREGDEMIEEALRMNF